MKPEKIPERSLHLPNLSELSEWFFTSRLPLVVSAFSFLGLVNSLTLVLGTQTIYDSLNSNSYTAFLSFIIYDTPGTIEGLLGVIVIFAVLSLFYFLITGNASRLRAIAFILTSVIVGVASQVVWNSCCNTSDTFPAGSSAIDFSALACLIVYSLSDSVRTLRLNVDRKSQLWLDSRLTALYFILVASILGFFALSLQPIYLPTSLYNWRVHEFAFVSAAAVSLVTETSLSLAKAPESVALA